MWSAVSVALRAGSVQILARRQPVISTLLRKQALQRINVFVACSYSKDSAIGRLLGISQEQSSNENVIHKYAPPVPFDKAESESLLIHKPDQPENAKVLNVAILGAPNAGKSTLSNKLLGRKVFPVSKKVHTTRSQAMGVLTEGETQLVILDTPGMVNNRKVKRHNLEKSLQNDPWDSMKSADVVLVMVDVSDHWTRTSLHSEVLKCLSQYSNIPSVLVMNKVDLVKKKSLLLDITNVLTEGVVHKKKAVVKPLLKPSSRQGPKPMEEETSTSRYEEPGMTVQQLEVDKSSDNVINPEAIKQAALTDWKSQKGWPHFQEVFMLSAIDGDEVETLKKYLLSLAKPGEWEYHSDVVTTQSPQEICNNIIREKLLEYLPQEIPYNVTQVTDIWEEGSGGELVIVQILLVSKENHVKLLIGRGGQLISKIAQEAGQDLMNIFLCDVRLRLAVKFKK